MTVKEVISYIRGSIKEHDSSKGVYTDSYLWETFLIAKANVFSNRRLRRFNYQNPQNKVGFCMELEEGLSHECGCLTYGCKILITKNKLPRFFSGRNISSLDVYTLGNKQIPLEEENDVQEVLLYSRIHKDKPMASIINNKLVLWNDLDKEIIRVKAYWEDPTEISEAQYCNDEDIQCVDVYSVDASVDMDIMEDILIEVYRILDIPRRTLEDQTNDSNPEIKE